MHRAFPLAALLALLCAAPALAQSNPPARSFIKLTKVDRVDLGPAGDSVGDMVVFSFRVLNRVGGRRIGAGHGYCVRTEVGVANDCLANASLPGGRIVFQWEEHDGQASSRAVVTGGTGRYRGTRVEVRLTSVSG
jgi:hypothetical protein